MTADFSSACFFVAQEMPTAWYSRCSTCSSCSRNQQSGCKQCSSTRHGSRKSRGRGSGTCSSRQQERIPAQQAYHHSDLLGKRAWRGEEEGKKQRCLAQQESRGIHPKVGWKGRGRQEGRQSGGRQRSQWCARPGAQWPVLERGCSSGGTRRSCRHPPKGGLDLIQRGEVNVCAC